MTFGELSTPPFVLSGDLAEFVEEALQDIGGLQVEVEVEEL